MHIGKKTSTDYQASGGNSWGQLGCDQRTSTEEEGIDSWNRSDTMFISNKLVIGKNKPENTA